jgi:LmbE family N-acetylglucosaminyl deacetylase
VNVERDLPIVGRGTDAQAWRGLRAGLRELRAPGGGDRLLFVVAHPDDETLGAGGLLVAAEAAGARMTVVVATDGEASHPASPTHTAAELAAIRRREVYAAITELAPSAHVVLLGLPDGFLDRHCDALRAHLEQLVDDSTHVVTTWCADRHPDHEACGRVVMALLRAPARRPVRHWQFPIWAWHWAMPLDTVFPVESMRRLPLDAAAVQAKQRAIASYPSQIAALSDRPGDEAVLSARMLDHFRGDDEVFVVMRGDDGAGDT